jgi:DUF4097 and DUF4098 domain-containing protein YvlB
MTARQDRVLALAIGAALTLLFTVMAGMHMVGWAAGTVTHDQHRVLSGNVRQITVDAGSGDVKLVPATGAQVVVDSHARGSLFLPKLRTRVAGDRIEVSGHCHIVLAGSCSASFVVHVPRGMPVHVSASSGDVSASGLSGLVDVSVSSGDVDLDDLSGGATVDVKSGDVSARALGGRIVLRTLSGDVTGADLTGAVVTAHSLSGDVDVDLASVPRTVTATTSSGDVTIAVPHTATAYAASADTHSGDHSVDVTVDPRSPRTLRARTLFGDTRIVYR